MNIDVVTVAHNEEKIVKYFIEHYLPVARNIYILNHQSTDRTEQVALSYGDKVKVIHVDFPFSNARMCLTKSEFCKSLDADFVIASDTDELIFPRNFVPILEECKDKGITVPKTTGYHMLSNSFDFQSDIYQIKMAYKDTQFDKKIVFNPKVYIIWQPGQHHIEYYHGPYVESEDSILQLRHYKYINMDHVLERNKVVGARLDPEELKYGCGSHHLHSLQRLRDEYATMKHFSVILD